VDILEPTDPSQLEEAICWALGAGTPLALQGSGSRADLGRPMETDCTLSLAKLTGITLYEPGELVLSARAGTPLAEIQSTLAQNNQYLPFEPVDCGSVLGQDAGISSGTLGGMVATALSGPRRIKAGAMRDHVLGFTAVTGRGGQVKSGGRVMKNVTGYDLSKLMTGSWGTLAAMAEITLKVLPAPDCEQTMLIHGLDDVSAIEILTQATGTSLDGSGFAHLPATATKNGEALTAIRFEGLELSVTQRLAAMKSLIETSNSLDIITDRSSQFWQVVRDGLPVTRFEGHIWRLSTKPTSGPDIITALQKSGVPLHAHYYDWAGGLIWLSVEPSDDAQTHALAIRAAVDRFGGHAMLVSAPPEIRATIPVFHPEPAPLAALTKRVKESFDPKFILNPGRMWEGT